MIPHICNLQIFLHYSHATKDGEQEGEDLKYFWKVTDMINFENIGKLKSNGNSLHIRIFTYSKQ